MAARADGDTVQTIRDDVPLGLPAEPPAQAAADRRETIWLSAHSELLTSDDGLGSLFFGLVGVGERRRFGARISSWMYDFSNDGYFRPFPYDTGMDYIEKTWSPGITRPLAVRLDAEYAATFDRLDNLAAATCWWKLRRASDSRCR